VGLEIPLGNHLVVVVDLLGTLLERVVGHLGNHLVWHHRDLELVDCHHKPLVVPHQGTLKSRDKLEHLLPEDSLEYS